MGSAFRVKVPVEGEVRSGSERGGGGGGEERGGTFWGPAEECLSQPVNNNNTCDSNSYLITARGKNNVMPISWMRGRYPCLFHR